MRNILFIFILFTLHIHAKALLAPKFTKQIVHCPDGSKSFILSKDDIYYSDRYKKFLFIREAGRDSCRNKQIRAKKGATVCMRKKDIYAMLKNKINKSTRTHNGASCLKLSRSVALKIIDHFPFTSQITYYQAKYKDKVFYISSQDIYKTKRYYSKKYKKRHKKNIHKKHKRVKKHKRRAKSKHRKKYISTRNNTFSMHKKKRDASKRHTKLEKTSKLASIQDFTNPSDLDTSTQNADTISYENSLIKKIANKQYYTYRCVGVYGQNRITVDNSYSMSDASNSVWRRCQALKNKDEICKITDCYKLIK